MGFNKKFFSTGGIVAASPSGITNTDNFSVITYAGTGGAQSTNSLSSQSGTVDFAPDFCWIKDRGNSESHQLFDSIRGAGEVIESDDDAEEVTRSDSLTSFNSNGFSLGTDSAGFVNYSGRGPYVAWSWKAGGTAVSGAGSGVTNVTRSTNTDAGFSIIKYTGGGSAGATIQHGLNAPPDFVIIKRTDIAKNWIVGSTGLPSWGEILQLDLSDEKATYGGFNSTTPSSTVITLGDNAPVNADGGEYICYAFHNVDKFQKFGSYDRNSSTTGPVVDVGFEPRFLLVKGYISGYSSHWMMIDSVRDTGAVKNKRVLANLTNVEDTDANWNVSFNSNGFQPKSTFSGFNGTGGKYLYWAIA